MRLFFSYSFNDSETVHKVKQYLIAKIPDLVIFTAKENINIGELWENAIKIALNNSDYIVIFLSKSSVVSSSVMSEYSRILYSSKNLTDIKILPILIEDCIIPPILSRIQYLDLREDFYDSLDNLISLLYQTTDNKEKIFEETDKVLKSQEDNIPIIKKKFQEENLSIVCGSGISKDSGIPLWDDLLKDLLVEVFKRDNYSIKRKMASVYSDYFPISQIILGRYLHQALGKNFLYLLKKSLYKNNPIQSKLIEEIAELSRPTRSKKGLYSIITFNFDDLIEKIFEEKMIHFKSIYKEGESAKIDEIPIYHVHGYLPRTGQIKKEYKITLSEDTYHSQFIDPYNWSNLIQIEHFSQRSCLFIGLTMIDPNLRRLLDITKRKIKGFESPMNHFIIKKRYSRKALEGEEEIRDTLVKTQEDLEEKDLNDFGINLIWIDSYEEIPAILKKIRE